MNRLCIQRSQHGTAVPQEDAPIAHAGRLPPANELALQGAYRREAVLPSTSRVRDPPFRRSRASQHPDGLTRPLREASG